MQIKLTQTTASEIAKAIHTARSHTGTATGLVFTLVVVVQLRHLEKALEAAHEAGREHPSRIILVVEGEGKMDRLDAEVTVGEDVPGDVITLRVNGEVAKHADSVVLPLLLPDSPVVVWWPNQSPDDLGDDPIGALADRRITDAAGVDDPLLAMRVRAKHHSPGDTDLTWTRLTPWRALLAAALDQYPAKITGVTVEADDDNAPAELLAAWLQSRLGHEVERLNTEGPGITGVRLHTLAGDLAVLRTDGLMASYEVPGQPRRSVALKRRDLTELLTEELRRMDADDIFEDATEVLLKRWEKQRRRASASKRATTKGTGTTTKGTSTKKTTAARTSRTTKPKPEQQA